MPKIPGLITGLSTDLNRSMFRRRPPNGRMLGVGILGLSLLLGAIAPNLLQASDHDDGETDTKGRNLNLTDLYAFRESEQNPNASKEDLVLIMNTNPRSVARQQYYFSTKARYEFYVSRVENNNAPATGRADVILRFEFSPPNKSQEQTLTFTALRDGKVFQSKTMTTPLVKGKNPQVKEITLGGSKMSVFAGLREDPFFFDVEQFFRVRAGALGIGNAVGFRPPNAAVDFATGYNVNAIALRIPRKFLQGNTQATTFDIWETISVPSGSTKGKNKTFTQVERVARPGVNEGLIVSNDLLNALNGVTPGFEAAALKGTNPAAQVAGPIVAEAVKTLKAIGNDDKRANTLINAFLPDVMRIDTQGPSGYANALNSLGSPIRGRLLLDDTIDTTLSVLSNGAITTDNVSYSGTPGNAAQGHRPLEKQFPYLALPN